MADYGVDLRHHDEDLGDEASPKFQAQEAKYVSATVANSVVWNEPVDAPDRLGFGPDHDHECDVHSIPIAFIQAVTSYKAESRFK